MPQGKKTVREEFHPFLGKTFSNILDEYDSSSYTAKLYIINGKTQSGEAAQSSESARDDLGSPGNINSVLSAPPEETVILAQTGVTAGNIIESISIPTIGGSDLAGFQITIKQPNRADFLDQLILARTFLNLESTEDLTVYLEIAFLGYESEADVYESLGSGTDTGGELANIIGPYRWKLHITQISTNLDSSGSTYDITLAPKSRVAYVNRIFRLNQNITAKGKTITEMVKSVEEGINKFLQTNNDKQIRDEVAFDLSGLIKSASNTSDQNKVLIEDENLILPDVNTGDISKAPLNRADANAQTSSETRIDESQESQSGNDELSESEVTNIINFQPGESMTDIMHKILAMCPEARARFCRKENPDDIDDQEVRKDQAFVQRLKINTGVEDLGFDKRTNMAAYKIIYRPVLYRTASDNQFIIPEENTNLSPDDVQTRLDQIIASGNIRKGYRYLYTGVNDQIINLDINYDNAIAIIMTPRRGLVGTVDAAAAKEKTDNVTKDEDTSVGGLLDSLSKGFEALAKDTISSLFSGEFSGIQGGLESLQATLQQQGFSNTQLAQLTQAIQSGAQSELNQFLETIDSATLRNLATNLIINPLNPTDNAPPTYSPEQSGYQYSEDFFAVNTTSGIDVSDLNSLGYLSNITRQDMQSQLETVTKETDTPTVNPVEGVTVDLNRSQSNSLFGQLVNQSASEPFMMEVNMTIRGDPWYIGYDISDGQNNNSQAGQNSSDSFESSQPEYAYFDGDDNYFFLEVAAPRPWDIDYRDEDSALNSGYWMNTNTSFAFTGVYRMLRVTHNFSNGLYTIDVQGVKESSLASDKIERQQPNSEI